MIFLAFILLHGPGGQDIWINPDSVVSVRSARKDEGHFQKGVRCIINTDDGKFTAVVEDCKEVEKRSRDEQTNR